MHQNVILSCAAGYTETQLKPMIVSAARTGMNCEIVLLRRTTDATLNFDGINLQNIVLTVATYVLPKLNSTGARKAVSIIFRATRVVPTAWRIILWRYLHVALNRYFICAEYLSKRPEIKNVILLDARDVVFQANPFEYLLDKKLSLFAEEDCLLENEPINRYWMDRLRKSLEFDAAIYKKNVICSGVTMGTRAEILDYLAAMIEKTLKAMPVVRIDGGFDQAIANVVVRSGQTPKIVVLPSGVVPIVHIGEQWSNHYEIQQSVGLVTKLNKTLIPIVHQYDRQPILIQHFSRILDIPSNEFPVTPV